MGLCVNPYCDRFCQSDPQNQLADRCHICGSILNLQNRYRLTTLLKPLQQSPDIKTFEAEDLAHLGQPVVLKLSDHPHHSSRSHLRQEYEFLLQMSPPFLQIGLDDYFEIQIHPDLPIVLHCLVLPKLDGLDSQAFIHQHGAVSIPQAVTWLLQLLDFVRVMHDQAYIHRDIKPSNILIHPDRTLSLIDFGTVRKMDKDYLTIIGGHLSTETGRIRTLTRIISPGFSAPEQIEGLAVPQSDFFSMARTFVYWVTGELPQTLPISQNGQLSWPKGIASLDGSLKQYINEMMSSAVEQRPAKSSLIQHYFTVQWPKSQRFQKLITSPWIWLLGAGCLLSLTVIGYVLFRFALSRFLFYRGSESIFDGQYQRARQDLSLSLKIDSKFEEAHHNLSSLCQDLKDYDCALHHGQAVLKLNAKRWQAHYNLGSILEDLNQFDEAQAAYEQAVRLSQSQSPLPLNNLARLKILLQQPEAAIAHLQTAQSLSPPPTDLAIIHKNLGWALWAQKQMSAGLKELRTAQDLNPNLADTYCLMAKIHQELNQSLESENNWLACLTLESDSRDVFQWREEFIQQTLFKKSGEQP